MELGLRLSRGLYRASDAEIYSSDGGKLDDEGPIDSR